MGKKLSIEPEQLKYIRVCEGSVRVKIDRGETLVIEHFHIRRYPSMKAAIDAAVEWRDKKHMELFGFPVVDKIVHIANRKNRKQFIDPSTGAPLPILPSGLSYGTYDEKLRYIVVSYQENGVTKKHRIPLKDNTLDAAIEQGMSFRASKCVL